jgi:hypothetical protein
MKLDRQSALGGPSLDVNGGGVGYLISGVFYSCCGCFCPWTCVATQHGPEEPRTRGDDGARRGGASLVCSWPRSLRPVAHLAPRGRSPRGLGSAAQGTDVGVVGSARLGPRPTSRTAGRERAGAQRGTVLPASARELTERPARTSHSNTVAKCVPRWREHRV